MDSKPVSNSHAPLPPSGGSRPHPLSPLPSDVRRFTSALVYQGLVMRLGIVGGNLYMNFFISGVVELPAALLILLTIERLGRRLPFAASNILAGVACLVTAFLPEGKCLQARLAAKGVKTILSQKSSGIETLLSTAL